MLILFQGDSITDSGRSSSNDPKALGGGFVQLIAAKLFCECEDIQILNRGINGNRISDLYGRWIEDALNIDYDILNILCGINDVGFGLRQNKGSDAKRFEFIYDRMLSEASEKHPNSKIVLCEPFVFKLDRELVPGNEDIVDNWDLWYSTLYERRQIIRKLSEKYHTLFVPFGEMFDELCKTTDASRWSVDGIHVTLAGAELMAREWIKCVINHTSEK